MGVDDLARAIEFWSAALHARLRREPDVDFAILEAEGNVGEGGVALSLDAGHSRVSLPPRIHLDLYADDQAAEVERLLALGARHIDWAGRPAEADDEILEDPDGNRFCVIDASPDGDTAWRVSRAGAARTELRG